MLCNYLRLNVLPSDVKAWWEPNANVSTKITILILQLWPPLSALKYNILQMKQDNNPTPQNSYGGWSPILSCCMAFPAHLHPSSSFRQFRLGHILSPLSLGHSFCSVALKAAQLDHGLLLSDPHSLPPSLSPPSPVYQLPLPPAPAPSLPVTLWFHHGRIPPQMLAGTCVIVMEKCWGQLSFPEVRKAQAGSFRKASPDIWSWLLAVWDARTAKALWGLTILFSWLSFERQGSCPWNIDLSFCSTVL